jgi:hypothetical protein
MDRSNVPFVKPEMQMAEFIPFDPNEIIDDPFTFIVPGMCDAKYDDARWSCSNVLTFFARIER